MVKIKEKILQIVGSVKGGVVRLTSKIFKRNRKSPEDAVPLTTEQALKLRSRNRLFRLLGLAGGGVALLAAMVFVYPLIVGAPNNVGSEEHGISEAATAPGDIDNPFDSDDGGDDDTEPVEGIWKIMEGQGGTLTITGPDGTIYEGATATICEDGYITIFDADGKILAQQPQDEIEYTPFDHNNPGITASPNTTTSPPSDKTRAPKSTTTAPDKTGDNESTTTGRTEGTTAGTTTAAVTEPPGPQPVSIVLSGSSATISDKKKAIVEKDDNGTVLRIRDGGEYVISGSWSNGRISINPDDDKAKIDITLNGVSITNTCRTGRNAVIYVNNAGSVTIRAEAGTTNTLVDKRGGRPESSDDVNDNSRNGAIFSREALTITGRGKLNITAGYAHAIASRKTLTVTNANITVVNAYANGLRSRHSMNVNDSIIDINASGKGLRAGGKNHGHITVTGGNINIKSKRDGIHAEVNLNMSNVTCNITTDGGRKTNPTPGMSKRGLRAGGDININGGTYKLNCSEDAVNSSTILTVRNATMTLETNRRALRGRNAITIIDSRVTVDVCGVGLRGRIIGISGSSRVNIHFVNQGVGLNDDDHLSRVDPKPDTSNLLRTTHCNGCH